MLRYFIFIEYGLLPDLRVGVLISASQSESLFRRRCFPMCGYAFTARLRGIFTAGM